MFVAIVSIFHRLAYPAIPCTLDATMTTLTELRLLNSVLKRTCRFSLADNGIKIISAGMCSLPHMQLALQLIIDG
ncbi:hypothetical protein PILCRDRAFT_467670 [Piloderma croceum F 1598]|uniref:Uncharacterized protein n=1 Tax=Piloderma croceum (strain F 1598) TaxID=765440 RepID=A0A0C3FS23_PILCF|nr:hypothetical protein PILCRDRAFT_467670 [Piloderma croceum F 1598]